MAEIEVEMPDGTVLAFPEGMAQGDIQAAAAKYWQDNQADTPSPPTAPERPRHNQYTDTPGVAQANVQEGYSIEETDRGRFLVSPQGQWKPIEVDGDDQGGFVERAIRQNPNDLARASSIAEGAERQSLGIDGGRGGGFGQVVAGAPFIGSYFDEVAGGAMNALTGADDGVQTARNALDTYQVANPGNSLAANIGGGVLGSIPLAAAAAPALMSRGAQTIGGRALQGLGVGAAIGGVEGFVYGSGRGEGSERAVNALTGGALGATIGGAVGAAAPYVGAGVKSLVQKLRTSDVQAISRELDISPEAARVIRTALDSGDDEAAEAAIARGGENAMLADANRSTQQLVDTAAQMPGGAGQVARDAVGERTRAASDQMTMALDDALGPARGVREITDEIRSSTSAARSTAYDAAYATPIDYSGSKGRDIERLLARVPDAAIRRANELMRVQGEVSAQIMARVGDDGRAVFERMPDVRQLDYITRALNDVASTTDGAGRLGGQTALGGSIEGLSRQIRQSLRGAVPEYGRALDTAADAISRRNATEMGSSMLTANVRREDVARALNGASQAERQAMREGVRSYVDEITSRVTRTVADPDTTTREGIRLLRDFSSRGNQQKMRMLLGRDADKMLTQLDEAATGFELRAAIAENSRTAARQATQGAVADQTSGGIVRQLASGEPVNAAKRIVQAFTGQTPEAQAIRQMGLYEEIAGALVITRGSQAQIALRLINRAIDGQALTERQASRVATVLTGALGGSAVPAANRAALQATGLQPVGQ